MSNSTSSQFPPAMMLAPSTMSVARARLRQVISGCPVLNLHTDALAEGLVDGPVLKPLAPGSVLSADHVLWSATAPEMERLATMVAAGQVLIFLEPTADVGWRRWVHRLGRPLWLRLLGHHFDSDVPAVVRATGLTMTDTVRFGLGPAGLFSYVYGRAEKIG